MPGAAPTPNLTLTVTPPGGSGTNYTTNLTYNGSNQQFTINQNFGRQGDTATIPLVDDWQLRNTPNFYIPVLSQVSLFDNNAGTNLFAGVVTDSSLSPTKNRNEWALQCTDYTFYADNAIVQGTFIGQSIDNIIVSLTKQANCGISAVKTGNGGFVAPAPVLAQVNFNWMKLSDAWRKLAQLASSSTPYGWYVDQNRALHFFDSSTAIASGATFVLPPTSVNASYTEGHFAEDSTFSYDFDGTTIRNRIIVQGANQTILSPLTGSPTDVWRADGTQTSWPLRYTVTGSPTLTVNGTSVAITVVNAGAAAPTTGWTIQQNAIGQWFMINPTPPAAGVQLKIWYNYQIPIVAQANDNASQIQYTGPNGGVYTEYIQDTSLITASMAVARAQRERTEYAFAVERVTFNTTEDFVGWVRAGETFKFTSPLVNNTQSGNSWGITNATFLCISNTVSFGAGGLRTMNITGVRL